MSMESQGKRKLLAVVVWIVILAIVVIAVKFFVFSSDKKLTEKTSSDSQYDYTATLNTDGFSGYSVFRSGEMRDALRSESIKLNVVDDGADYPKRMKALKDGDCDMAVFTIDSFLKAGALLGEFPGTIVMAIDETKGADAIIAYKSAVKNISALNHENASFVLTPDSPSEFIARVVKADINLSKLPKDWIKEADGAEDVYKKFKKASRTNLSAYALWEPWVSKALEDSDAHVILGSDKLKGYIVDVLVVRRKFLADHPEIVETIIKAYLRAAYSHKSNMVELVMEDAKALGDTVTKSQAENIVKGVQWKNTLENYGHFRLLSRAEVGDLDDIEDMLEKILKVLVKTGAITSNQVPDNLGSLFYNKTLENIKNSNFHPGQNLGLITSNALELDKVRVEEELKELSDEEWDRLIPVGEMSIRPLSFSRGGCEMNVQGKRDLEDLAIRLKSFPRYYLIVVGNARAEGDMDANIALAEGRAMMAADFLINRIGINPDRVKAIGKRPSGDVGRSQSVNFQLGQMPY